MSMKSFNTVAAAALGIFMLAAGVTQAAAPEVHLVNHKNKEAPRFLPDWARIMDSKACSKDGHTMHAAFKVYAAVNHLETVGKRLQNNGGVPADAHRMIAASAYKELNRAWRTLAAENDAGQLTGAGVKTAQTPRYTELLQKALNTVHQETDISAFAELIELNDSGPGCQPN